MNSIGQQTVTNRVASRIDADIDQLKILTLSVDNVTESIIRHARALGYYQPTPEPGASAPTPIVTTLADVLQALTRAIEHCSGSLKVFE